MRVAWLLVVVPLLAGGATSCESRREPLMSISGPTDLVRLEVRDSQGRALWVIESEHPKRLRYFFYGELPEGFVQREPRNGAAPRPLVKGERLTTETLSTTRIFVHEGFATSRVSFRPVSSAMRLIDPSKAGPQ